MDIPASVEFVYKKNWKGWGEFLGTHRIASHLIVYRTYEEAKKYAQSLNLKSRKEWAHLSKTKKLPKDIPAAVSNSDKYKNKWESWGEFLGTGNKSKKKKS
jgi:hypothetical protein